MFLKAAVKSQSFMSKNRVLTIYIFLGLATLLAFWRVTRCDFISFDDPQYVTENIHVQHGIAMEGIRWAFTTDHAGNWHPLTWVSLMLDVQLFGVNPRGHHLINLLFHIANTLLLFYVFNRMTKAPWKSAFVAALFALHPLHVESVAWVSERKDVLSTFFWMLTMGAYISYAAHPRFRTYLPVFALFALGLTAKPMLVTLPFVLLLLDYWPLQRIEQKPATEEVYTEVSKRAGSRKGTSFFSLPTAHRSLLTPVRLLLLEKMPLITLAAISSVITFVVQQRESLVVSHEALPPGDRIANAFISYVTYIGKAIWPSNLAFYYPYQWWASWQVLGALLFFITVTSIVIWLTKRWRYLTVGWLWYVVTLVPVIGLVQVGSQVRADRYTYIPLIGVCVMAAWGIPELLKERRYRKEVLIALSTITLSCFFIATWIQVGYWQNSLILFDHTLKVTDKNYIAFKHRGDAYATLGNLKNAIADFDRAIAINPQYGLAYMGRAAAKQELGNNEEAISDYDRAVVIMPKFATAYYYRGNAYAAIGKYTQAIEDYDRSIRLEPSGQAYGDRGYAYAAIGKYKQAIEDYDKAIQLLPGLAMLYADRGIAYAALGKHQQAIEDYDRAIQILPSAKDYGDRWVAYAAEAYGFRGVAYAALGKYQQAIEDYDRAIQIQPSAEMYGDRGIAYAALGKYQQAIADYDRAIQIQPRLAGLYIGQGIAYTAIDQYKQAISDFDKAIEINPENAAAYNNRGLAHAKLGNRQQAIEDLKTAAKLGSEQSKNLLKSQGIIW